LEAVVTRVAAASSFLASVGFENRGNPMTREMAFVCLFALVTTVAGANEIDQRWQSLANQGRDAERAGDYRAAFGFYKQASDIAETFAPSDTRRIFSLNGVGMMHDAMGQFVDAENAYRRGLSLIDPANRALEIDRAVLLANIAVLYLETGQSKRAEKLLREAMALHAAADTPDKARLAVVQNCLADLLTTIGKYHEAEPLLMDSLAILEKDPVALGEIGVAQNNLGVVRLYQKRYPEAQKMLETSLATLERARGANHPLLLKTLFNLAITQQALRQPRLATLTWSRAVDLAAATIGLEHPLYGEILGRYARHLKENGDKEKSKVLAARSAEILRETARRNGIGTMVDVSALQRK
jgi:tetratricopeptide (TPR) repeat protein